MNIKFDVVVIGSATSGCSAAFHFAKVGYRVAIVEARTIDAAGSTWSNAVPAWMFERAGVPVPKYPESTEGPELRFHMRNYRDEGSISFMVPNIAVDMRKLNQRLVGYCREHGVTFFEKHTPVSVGLDETNRLRKVVIESSIDSSRIELEASLFVDASGLRASLKSLIPSVAATCPYPEDKDLCVASQMNFVLNDREAALQYMKSRGAGEHSILCALGMQGGYSTLNYEIDLEHKVVGILTGTGKDANLRDTLKWIEEEKQTHSWIGDKIYGGRGTIPIRRVYHQFAFAGLALVGDAACMVFPVHGSGVGTGMIGGKILAERATAYKDIGSLRAMEDFQKAYMSEIGSMNATYDVFRQFSMNLPKDHTAFLLSSDFMMPSATKSSLQQKILTPDWNEIVKVFIAAVRFPMFGLKMLPILFEMKMTFLLYKLYPRPRGPLFSIWKVLVGILPHGVKS